MKYYKYTLRIRYEEDTTVNESKTMIKEILTKIPGSKFTLTREKVVK